MPRQILDPACGTNHFFANMPKVWQEQSALIGVELDTLSAAMAQARVHQSNVHCLGFEQYHNEQSFDLVIGNPPYGKQTIDDKNHPDLMQYCIHHAFALKAFRALKVGGYLCLLLPCWFLDNGAKHVRDLIAAENGELIEAVRFPDNLFQNAKVTVDCVLIKKCANGQNDKTWTQLERIELDGRRERINRYFIQHPKQVLGKLASVPMYERFGLTCQFTSDPIALWQQGEQPKIATATITAMTEKGAGQLDHLIAQCEEKIRTLQNKYRELTGLKCQQQVMEARINALLR